MKIAFEFAGNQSKQTDGIFLGATTLSIMALSIKGIFVALNLINTQYIRHCLNKTLYKRHSA